MDVILSYFAVGLLALLLGAFFARQKQDSITVEWQRAFALAQELVPAVEQLFLTGKISKAQRFDEVMKELRLHFPLLTEKQLRWAAENAVHLMNMGKLIPLVTEPVNYTVNLPSN